jgi:hypothetical protein
LIISPNLLKMETTPLQVINMNNNPSQLQEASMIAFSTEFRYSSENKFFVNL